MACKCTQTTVNATAGGSTTAALSACTYPLWISMLSGCTAGLPATNTQSDVLISNPSANIVFNTGYPEGCNDSYSTCNQYVNNIGINETRPQHTLSIGGTIDVRDYIHFGRGDEVSLTGGTSLSTYLGWNSGRRRKDNSNSSSNTSVGFSSMGEGVLDGAQGNTAMGVLSLLQLTSGDWNTSIGMATGGLTTTGSENTFLGYASGTYNSTGSGNVYLGYYQGGEDVNESNKLRIGNQRSLVAGNTRPLIQGDFATSGLTVNGNLELEGTLTGDGDGSTGGNEWVDIVGGVRASGAINAPNLQFPTVAQSMYIGLGLNGSGTPGIDSGSTTTDIYNTAVGFDAMSFGNGNRQSNTAVGKSALKNAGAGGANSSGGNTVVGAFAHQNCNNCNNNTALGDHAMISLNDGSHNNVAVGAGYSLWQATGSGNVAVGYSSLKQLESESYNTSLGFQSMYLATTGSQNVAIGYNTVSEPTALNDFNVYVGSKSGQNAATRGYGTVALGYGTMTGGTISSSNIAIGYNAQIPYTEDHFMNIGDIIYARKGEAGTDGRDTILLGRDAYTSGVGISTYTVGVVGALSATGAIHSTDYMKFPNVAQSMYIGYSTNSGTTSDSYNTVFGYEALKYINGNSNSNTIVGTEAMQFGGGGGGEVDSNTIIGSQAGDLMMDNCDGNVAVGAGALAAQNGSKFNTAIGTQTMRGVGVKEYGVAVGWGSQQLSTESYNTTLGSLTMGLTTTGSQNVSIGYKSTYNSTLMDDFNVYIGGKSGYHASTKGYGNVHVGYGTATGGTVNNDVICLGYNAQPALVADHTMNLGDVIYAGPGSTTGSSGRKAVGINVTEPLTALDVKYDNILSLASDRGGGSDIITFGVAGAGYAAHTLVQLRGTDNWVPADADHTTMQGNLVGISMGDEPELGILLKGYYNVTTADDITTWANGGPLYVSTVAGKVTESIATHGPGDYIRLMGYMTTTANVIYFNPDNTFIVL